MAKELSGAQVMAMAEDVPALRAMKPGGKEHPVDRTLNDGGAVTLGGTTLIAHLTPGHTARYYLDHEDNGRRQDLRCRFLLQSAVAGGSDPALIDEFNRSFKFVRSLPCDVRWAITPANTTCRKSSPGFGTAVPIPSSTPPAAIWKRI